MRLSRALLALAALAIPSVADAYPQFQLTTGATRCSQCHYSPTGGGLINGYGRYESDASVSMFEGESDFLYGVYEEPDWVKLGLDFRAAAVAKDQAADPELLVFPMMGDTYARFEYDAWSLYLNVGPRAQARSEERQSVATRFGSREHYVMWRKQNRGYYARAGRYLAPFGLRSQDHTWYVRRDLGLYTWDETYNATFGRVESDWEVHATAFTPVPFFLQPGAAQESGTAVYYERRAGADDQALYGVQSRVGFSDGGWRTVVGGVGKYHLEGPELLVMGELDFALQSFSDPSAPSRGQMVSYLGTTWIPTQGIYLTAAHERFDEDLSVKNLERDAFSVALQYFPITKWEIMLIGKTELHGTRKRVTNLGMFQLHYYL